MTEDVMNIPGANLDSVCQLIAKVKDNKATIADYEKIDYFMNEFGHILRGELYDRLRDASIYSWEAFIYERNKPYERRKEIADVLPGALEGFLTGLKRLIQLGEIEQDFSEPVAKGRTRW